MTENQDQNTENSLPEGDLPANAEVVEAPPADLKARAEALRHEAQALGEKTRTYANEIAQDTGGLAKSGLALVQAAAVQLREELPFRATPSPEPTAPEADANG